MSIKYVIFTNFNFYFEFEHIKVQNFYFKLRAFSSRWREPNVKFNTSFSTLDQARLWLWVVKLYFWLREKQ